MPFIPSAIFKLLSKSKIKKGVIYIEKFPNKNVVHVTHTGNVFKSYFVDKCHRIWKSSPNLIWFYTHRILSFDNISKK